MPRYTFTCIKHGSFDQIAGIEDSQWPCHCGRAAEREAVYREQGVIFKGGGFTKSVVPPPGPDAQAELHGELRKRGWDEDRAIGEIRANTITTEKGKKLNLAGMTKGA